MEIKKGKLSTSHRYDLLPLLRSSPGGIRRELVVYDFPDCKYSYFFCFCKINVSPDLDAVEYQREKVIHLLEFPYSIGSNQ